MRLSSKKIEGGLLGLLVGDALGVPYEFHPPEAIPAADAIEMTPPSGFRRAHASVAPGTWSDDGAQALCLLASLVEKGKLDLEDFGNRMVRWLQEGYMAVGGHVYDVGIGTRQSLGRMASGTPVRESGGAGERDNGNGSLMRVLPLVLWHQGSDAELARDAMLQSLPTHAHPRSHVCCALYCIWARYVAAEDGDVDDSWDAAVSFVEDFCSSQPEHLRELNEHVRPREAFDCRGTGYVVDCLHSAHAAVRQPTYTDAVRTAISFGNDTDTTACVAGGIAGIIHGSDAIPERWRDSLRGRELLDPLLEALLAT
jgi:ADP-ribosylglycohydrolase